MASINGISSSHRSRQSEEKAERFLTCSFSGRSIAARRWGYRKEVNTDLQDMAYRRSITSSDDDSTGPKFTKERSDSSDSPQSGTSAKYRWMWDYSSRRHGETPSPMGSPESSEEDKENIHPALLEVGEQAESEEEEDPSEYPVFLDPPEPIEISDDSLVEVIQRAAQSSYTGPPGFEPVSAEAAADMQHHLNFAHQRIEQLENEMGQRQYAHEEVLAENIELADRVAEISTAFVMMGMGTDAADQEMGVLLIAVAVLVLMVLGLIVRSWM